MFAFSGVWKFLEWIFRCIFVVSACWFAFRAIAWFFFQLLGCDLCFLLVRFFSLYYGLWVSKRLTLWIPSAIKCSFFVWVKQGFLCSCYVSTSTLFWPRILCFEEGCFCTFLVWFTEDYMLLNWRNGIFQCFGI